ncbi:MAG: hypothetical protein H0T76_17430 [Nannocystis sp.]|nr:hypothetical protein [Nannocystis sp.]
MAAHAALAGLCPLIPIPYLDEMVIRRIWRRMFRALFDAHGLELGPAGAKLLTRQPSRLRGAAASVAWLPLRRLLRKVAYVLAIKDCADVAVAVFHDGWLMAHVLQDSQKIAGPGRSPTDPAVLKRIRKAMLRTYEEVDPAPLRRALVGSFHGARVGARHALEAVKRALRREPIAEEQHGDDVDALSTRMRDAAMDEWQYLEKLEQRFRHNLGLPERRGDLRESPSALSRS